MRAALPLSSALVLTAFTSGALVLALGLAWSTDEVHPVLTRTAPAPPLSTLPAIGRAPDFALVSQDGASVRLADFRGKVLAVTFIYTLCSSTCPVLTPLMARVRDDLGPDFGERIAFASITVDPERDTPEVLKLYAQSYDADVASWRFLTGPEQTIREVTRRYGVYAAHTANGDIDHSFLTSVVDWDGLIRVQYIGTRFDPDEFRQDLVSFARAP